MAKDIAVVGDSTSIEHFRLLGCEIYESRGGLLTQKQLDEIMSGGFKIVLVTEEVFLKYRDSVARRTEGMYPVVSIVPDLKKAVWVDQMPRPGKIALDEMRAAVIKAVGQDIVPR